MKLLNSGKMSFLFFKRSFVFVCFFMMFVCGLWAKTDDEYLNNLLNRKYDGIYLTSYQIDSIFREVCEADSGVTIEDRYSIYYEGRENRYRRSFYAKYYAEDKMRKDTFAVSEDTIRDAVVSPNNRYVVYAKKDNNLYISKLDFRTEVAITRDTFPFINGVSDWLYEEEFGTTRLFSFSPDAKYVAFVKLDISEMEKYHWLTYSDTMLYPTINSLYYPKVHTPNPIADVYVYDTYYKTIRPVKIDRKEGDYFTDLKWRKITPSNSKDYACELIIEKINRDQNQMYVYAVNPKSQTTKILYKESSSKYYIDYSLFGQSIFMEDGNWLMLSEKEGWTCLYLCSENGLKIERLTELNMDVTKIYGVDENTGNVYLQVAPNSRTRQVFSYNLKSRKMVSLSNDTKGWYELYLSKDKKYYILSYESNRTPIRYKLYNSSSNQFIRSVFDNTVILGQWVDDGLPCKEFFSFKTTHGDSLYGWMLKPRAMERSGNTMRYPVVVMQYNGPGSQRVVDKWAKRFGHYLAYEGYIVVCIDSRGTGGRGRVWRNASYLHLGEVEAEDVLYTALYLSSLPFVDSRRMAICGWSYGGFVTLNTLMEQQVFAKKYKMSHLPYKCGIAIAPVTDWRYYDSGYTERYMRTLGLNEDRYDQTSLLNKASRLSGELLLVHGLADDNVHFQHSVMMIDFLNKANKMYDLQIYPNDNHSIRKEENRIHLHKKILMFLNKNLQ